MRGRLCVRLGGRGTTGRSRGGGVTPLDTVVYCSESWAHRRHTWTSYDTYGRGLTRTGRRTTGRTHDEGRSAFHHVDVYALGEVQTACVAVERHPGPRSSPGRVPKGRVGGLRGSLPATGPRVDVNGHGQGSRRRGTTPLRTSTLSGPRPSLRGGSKRELWSRAPPSPLPFRFRRRRGEPAGRDVGTRPWRKS